MNWLAPSSGKLQIACVFLYIVKNTGNLGEEGQGGKATVNKWITDGDKRGQDVGTRKLRTFLYVRTLKSQGGAVTMMQPCRASTELSTSTSMKWIWLSTPCIK